jgi:DNA-binding transcriptional regulator GbsR (MarR family)
MADNWEDWEDAEIDLMISSSTDVIQKEEELKRIEERKLVEESDNALSKELFETKDNISKIMVTVEMVENIKTVKQIEKEDHKKINKQKENENKQKELSKKIKESKIKQKRHNELYGELEGEYIYDDYDDKFYN